MQPWLWTAGGPPSDRRRKPNGSDRDGSGSGNGYGYGKRGDETCHMYGKLTPFPQLPIPPDAEQEKSNA